jgi:hypothetical protein
MAVEVERLLMHDIEAMSADELLRAATSFTTRDSGGSLAG